MIPKSVQRFSVATNAERVCAEIMRKTRSMIPKSVQRFSVATNAERVCAEIMRKSKEA
jgi:hypothetical protein